MATTGVSHWWCTLARYCWRWLLTASPTKASLSRSCLRKRVISDRAALPPALCSWSLTTAATEETNSTPSVLYQSHQSVRYRRPNTPVESSRSLRCVTDDEFGPPSIHDDVQACQGLHDGERSGCKIAPLLFDIFFAVISHLTHTLLKQTTTSWTLWWTSERKLGREAATAENEACHMLTTPQLSPNRLRRFGRWVLLLETILMVFGCILFWLNLRLADLFDLRMSEF